MANAFGLRSNALAAALDVHRPPLPLVHASDSEDEARDEKAFIYRLPPLPPTSAASDGWMFDAYDTKLWPYIETRGLRFERRLRCV